MSDVERDPVVRRAIDELQKVPAADAAAIRRVVAAAAAARVTPADGEPLLGERRGPVVRFWGVAGIAAAAAFVGFALSSMRRDAVSTPPESTSVATVAQTVGPMRPVGSSAAELEALPIPQQFVLARPSAERVSLVGDFNKWNPGIAPMKRDANGSWSITLPITPGRHIYGYMVDDSLFVLDPRAPKAHDRDLGADGSVVIVGKP